MILVQIFQEQVLSFFSTSGFLSLSLLLLLLNYYIDACYVLDLENHTHPCLWCLLPNQQHDHVLLLLSLLDIFSIHPLASLDLQQWISLIPLFPIINKYICVSAYSNEIMQINQEYYENLISNTHMHFLCLVTCQCPLTWNILNKLSGLSSVPSCYCNKEMKLNMIIINKPTSFMIKVKYFIFPFLFYAWPLGRTCSMNKFGLGSIPLACCACFLYIS